MSDRDQKSSSVMPGISPLRLSIEHYPEAPVALPASRRRFLGAGLALVGSAWVPPAWALPTSSTARLWPAKEYTRLVIETPHEVPFQMNLLEAPYRLVLDVEKLELGTDLMGLPARLNHNDPYISGIRLGRRDKQVLRLVLDLKDRVDPQVFTLKPVADFGFRLVLDIYPVERVDPLLALVKEFDANDNMAALEQKYADDDALLLLVREYEKRPATNTPATAGSSKTVSSTGQSTTTPPTEKNPAAKTPAGTATGKPANPPPGKPASTTTAKGTGNQSAKGGKDASAQRSKARPIIVMLDPGHGGEDPGAIGRQRTFEKNVVLAIAKQVKKLIDAEPNMRAALTRDGDFFVPLNQRVEKARRIQADLMVSIHADAFSNQSARGSSVFALSERGASSAAARWLADKENDADLVGGVNIDAKDAAVAKTLLDLSQSAQINDSMRIGALVLTALGTHNALHKGEVEQAGFAVLKAPDIPSILVETAFLSNPEEEAKLRDPKHQLRFAQSIADGIKRYFALNPPLARL